MCTEIYRAILNSVTESSPKQIRSKVNPILVNGVSLRKVFLELQPKSTEEWA